MRILDWLCSSLVLVVFAVFVGCSKPADAIKVGVIASFSGPFASSGSEIEGGMKAYALGRAARGIGAAHRARPGERAARH
jgi:hypothetical protein